MKLWLVRSSLTTSAQSSRQLSLISADDTVILQGNALFAYETLKTALPCQVLASAEHAAVRNITLGPNSLCSQAEIADLLQQSNMSITL